MLYPLSYGRIVFGAQCTIANYSITASFLQVLYWVDEIKNIIKQGFDGQEVEYELYNIKDVATVHEQF